MKRRVARNSSPEDAAHREHDGHAHTPGRKLGRPGLKLCLLPYFLTTWSVLGKLRKDAGIHSQPHTVCGLGNDAGDRKPTPLIAKVTGSRPQGRRHGRGRMQKRPKGQASALLGAAGAAGPRVLSQARTLPPFSFPRASPPPFLQFSVWGITWWILKPLREQQSACDLFLFFKFSLSYS